MINNELANYLLNKKHAISLELLQLNCSDKLGPNKKEALTILSNAQSLGFEISTQLVYALSFAEKNDTHVFWRWFSSEIKKSFGYHKEYKPMYPNFPQQVISATDEQLMLNALKHYDADLSGNRFIPETSTAMREPLDVNKEPLKAIVIYHDDDIEHQLVSLLNSNSSLSVEDAQAVVLLYNYLNEKGRINEAFIASTAIEQKETLALFANLLLKNNRQLKHCIFDLLSSPTDVLRIAVAYSDGDVSLSNATKFKSFPRSLRKDYLCFLESLFAKTQDADQLLENMYSYEQMWKKLSHSLHVGEYNEKYPLSVKAVMNLRNGVKPQNYNACVDSLIQSDVLQAANLLKQRPGVFARNLSRLLQVSSTMVNDLVSLDILSLFSSVAHSVATPVLVQLHSHFKASPSAVRVFMPKGGLSKVYATENNLTQLDSELSTLVTQLCEDTLIKRFSQLPSLGNVYIDPQLKKQFVPFAQRSASKALHTVTRGSRFEMEKGDIIRLFLGWSENGIDKNGEKYGVGRVDIDLSCLLIDENYKTMEVCSYYNLRNNSGALVHSGDITSAPKGAAEYIDIDKSKLDGQTKYVAMVISSYTKQPYADLPECFAGWMQRDKAQKGKIFEYSTVKNKIDLTSQSMQLMPAIFDIEKNEFIWTDISVPSNFAAVNNVTTNDNALTHTVRAMVNLQKPTLYDLFEMHAKARGVIVQKVEDADTVFSMTQGITPFMFEEINSQYLINDTEKLNKKLKM